MTIGQIVENISVGTSAAYAAAEAKGAVMPQDKSIPNLANAIASIPRRGNQYYNGDRPLVMKLSPKPEEIYLLADLHEFKMGWLGTVNSWTCNCRLTKTGNYLVEQGHIDDRGEFVADVTEAVGNWANYSRPYSMDDPDYLLFRVRPQDADNSFMSAVTATTDLDKDGVAYGANCIVEANFNTPSLSSSSMPTLMMPAGYPYNSRSFCMMRKINAVCVPTVWNMQGCHNLEELVVKDYGWCQFRNASLYNSRSLRSLEIHNCSFVGQHHQFLDQGLNLVALDLEDCDMSKCVQIGINVNNHLRIFKFPKRAEWMFRCSLTLYGQWFEKHDNLVSLLNALPDNTALAAYSSSRTYAIGDWVVYNAKVYGCKTAISAGEAFNASKWVEGGKWTLGATGLSLLNDTEKEIATNKGWTLA